MAKEDKLTIEELYMRTSIKMGKERAKAGKYKMGIFTEDIFR